MTEIRDLKNHNPIIWKKEDCIAGECKGESRQHWWSIPFSEPAGLTVQCYHCNKTRRVHVEKQIPEK
jgi:hypothetical protein